MDVYQRALTRAFRILAARPRSIAEMRERLLEKQWADPESVEVVLSRLVELGYLDDQKYAEQYVNSRLAERPLGRTRIRRLLQQKSIPNSQIDLAVEEAFADDRESALIDRAIAKRTRLRGLPATREESRKLLQHLIRLGFSFDLAMKKLRELPLTDRPEED